jgi:gamma-glutamyltranspeptidase
MPAYSTPIVLNNILKFKMDPYEAVDAPRFWWLDGDFDLQKGSKYTVQVENRISENSIKELAKFGVQVKPLGDYRWNTGSFQIIWQDNKSGLIKGTSDPRRLGYAEGY